MKKIIFLFCVFLSYTIFSQDLKITLKGNVTVPNIIGKQGITVTIDTYNEDPFYSNFKALTTTTDENGDYSFSFTIKKECNSTLKLCTPLTLYITFTKGVIKDSLEQELVTYNENDTEITRTVTRSPTMGAYTPKICMVSYEKESGNLMVVWERIQTENIKSYIIHRSTDGIIYKAIDTVPFNDISIYIDKTSKPDLKYYYKLQSILNDNSLSPLGKAMINMKLDVVQNSLSGPPNRLSLKWFELNDANYIDFMNASSIEVYRKYAGGKTLDKIKAVDIPAKIDPARDHQKLQELSMLLDTVKYNGKYVYQIVMNLREMCAPATLKADSGPFSQSLSNLAESSLITTGVDDPNNTNTYSPKMVFIHKLLKIIPVPSKDYVKISIPENGILQIIKTNGDIVKTISVRKGDVIINKSDIGSGIFAVKFTGSVIQNGNIIFE
ncbi:MAG: hypothetical protein SNJ71_07530 [Bacteroidales bacterium]